MKKTIENQVSQEFENVRYSTFIHVYEFSVSQKVFFQCENNILLDISMPDQIVDSMRELFENHKKS